MTNTTNEKSPAGADNTNEGKSFADGSTTTAYLAYRPGNTRHTFGTWSGTDLPMDEHITIIVPVEVAQRMYADGPQLIDVNRACADAQSAEVRRRRAEAAAKRRQQAERAVREEVEHEFADELDAADETLNEIYERIDARVRDRMGKEENR